MDSPVILVAMFAVFLQTFSETLAAPTNESNETILDIKNMEPTLLSENWGLCEPLKTPLDLPEVNDNKVWQRCERQVAPHAHVDDYISGISLCMLRKLGWILDNGDIEFDKYLEHFERIGLDMETLNKTEEAHVKCRSLAFQETDFKDQDRVYVTCIFNHFSVVCGVDFNKGRKEGYLPGVTELLFIPRTGPVHVIDTIYVNASDRR
ncbi:uncharacterized protein LOC143236389 [Tachypleus tridentatus]|uniref:uncharacterized protein LOC143236389 n=1 Tax=Tachypleus tridentatus TaxID=6853 RepID=UPI003FD2E163